MLPRQRQRSRGRTQCHRCRWCRATRPWSEIWMLFRKTWRVAITELRPTADLWASEKPPTREAPRPHPWRIMPQMIEVTDFSIGNHLQGPWKQNRRVIFSPISMFYPWSRSLEWWAQPPPPSPSSRSVSPASESSLIFSLRCTYVCLPSDHTNIPKEEGSGHRTHPGPWKMLQSEKVENQLRSDQAFGTCREVRGGFSVVRCGSKVVWMKPTLHAAVLTWRI